jgi:nucleotide-binding universal stress UspA family protein
MQRIMLATDFSERSDRALRRAVILARAHDARIELVHVVDDDRPRRVVEQDTRQARQLLSELARSLETLDGISCDTKVILADPFAGIAEAVEDANPDLLIIGPHRRSILRDAFVGTTAERTIRVVSCPVLMVNGTPVGNYRHVLLTTDLSDNSRLALQLFETLKIGQEGSLSALSVFNAPALQLAMSGTLPTPNKQDYLNALRAEARRELVAFMAKLGGTKAEQIVRFDETTIAHEVLKSAAELKSDLIVVSTHGKGAVSRMLLGSVTEQILRSASVDVLAIPPFR